MASFQPVKAKSTAEGFFESYLAAAVVIALYLFWKAWTRGKGGLFVRAHDMDLTTGIRTFDYDPQDNPQRKKSLATLPKRILNSFV